MCLLVRTCSFMYYALSEGIATGIASRGVSSRDLPVDLCVIVDGGASGRRTHSHDGEQMPGLRHCHSQCCLTSDPQWRCLWEIDSGLYWALPVAGLHNAY
ncbi:unnamed protein product, partial [Iphiclides podalirius]